MFHISHTVVVSCDAGDGVAMVMMVVWKMGLNGCGASACAQARALASLYLTISSDAVRYLLSEAEIALRDPACLYPLSLLSHLCIS